MRPRPPRPLASALACVALLGGCTCGERSRPARGDAPAVLIVDPEEDTAEALAEQEPNDTPARAQGLDPEERVQGALQRAGDEDWYRVGATADGQVLSATVSGVVGLDLVLEAYDAAGQRLMRVDNGQQGSGEVLVNLAVEAGGYTLRVLEKGGQASGAGTYRLSYRLRAREPGEEVEPNWKAALATPLALEAEATGYLGWPTDTDWYRLDLGTPEAGARLRVEFDGLDDVRAGLSVRDSAGKVLQERWGPAGAGLVLANLRPPAQDPVFVVLRCRTDTNVESRYYLRALLELPRAETEAEPNDRREQATALRAGAQSIDGLLADSQDRDVFLVQAQTPQLVRVEASPPFGLNLALAVLGPGRKPLYEVDEGGAAAAEVIPALPVAPPGALIQVRAPRWSETSTSASYRIRTRLLPRRPTELEPNGAPAQASAWPLAAPRMHGYLHPAKDEDFLRLEGGAGPLRVSAQAPPGLQLQLQLLDAQGRPLPGPPLPAGGASVSYDPAAAQEGAGPGTQAPPGTLLLRVREAAGAANADEPYLLTLVE